MGKQVHVEPVYAFPVYSMIILVTEWAFRTRQRIICSIWTESGGGIEDGLLMGLLIAVSGRGAVSNLGDWLALLLEFSHTS